MVLMPLLSRLLTLLVILTMPLFLARLTLIPIKSLSICFRDRKSGSAGMPRPISYAVFCLKKKREPGGAAKARKYLNIDLACWCTYEAECDKLQGWVYSLCT